MNFNPYFVLGVPASADFDAMRTAYRRLARENHPDIALDKIVATERMAQINRAWAVLGDTNKRAAFDSQWQLHLIEQARQEAKHQEMAQREAAQRDLLRKQIERARAGREAAKAAKSSRTTARVTKNPTPNTARSPGRGTSGMRSKFVRKASDRTVSSSKSPRESTARSAAPRDPASRDASRTGRTFAEETSPRALRLMRKVTLAARVWKRDGNARAAIDTCRAVLLADVRNIAARELLAEIYAVQGRHELAVMMLDQAIQIAPDDRFLRNKRERFEIARAPIQAPRPSARPTFWQRLRAHFGTKSG